MSEHLSELVSRLRGLMEVAKMGSLRLEDSELPALADALEDEAEALRMLAK